MKLILYHNNLLKFGGVDTFVYNFVKKMNKYFDILFLYTTADKNNLERIKKYVKTEQYSKDKKYICDICICASAWGQYPDSVIAKSGRYIQMVHADYIKAKEIGFIYNKWHKTTEHIGVSNYVCKIFKELYPNEKITRIYNILDEVKESIENGDIRKAETLLKGYLDFNNDTEVASILANIYTGRGELNEALAVLKDQDSNYFCIFKTLSEVYIKLQKYDKLYNLWKKNKNRRFQDIITKEQLI